MFLKPYVRTMIQEMYSRFYQEFWCDGYTYKLPISCDFVKALNKYERSLKKTRTIPLMWEDCVGWFKPFMPYTNR